MRYESHFHFLCTSKDILGALGPVSKARFPQDQFPEITLSHMRWRSKDDQDFAKLVAFGEKSGTPYITDHNGRKMAFIVLDQPLVAGGFKLECIEITAPKKDVTFKTGPDALVFSDPFAPEKAIEYLAYKERSEEDEKNREDNPFYFRWQRNHYTNIIGRGP